MYTTRGHGFQNRLGQDVRTCQNLFDHEQLFLYKYARYLLHRQLVTEGLLSPYSNQFYPPTDKTNSTMEKNKNNESNIKINKEAIAERLQKNTDVIILKEDTQNTNTKEWKELKINRAKTINVQKSTKKYEGYYDELQDEENEEEEVQNEIKEDVKDEIIRPAYEVKKHGMKKDYNVNTMGIEEMDKVIVAIKKEHNEEEESNEEIFSQTEKDKVLKNENVKKHQVKENQGYDERDSESRAIESRAGEEEDITFDDSSNDSDSEDAFTIGSTDEEISDGEELESEKNHKEENLHRNEERDRRMEQLLYQNDLLLFRLEQAEMNEEKLRTEMYLQIKAKKNDTDQEVIKVQKQLKDKEEEWRIKVNEYEHKIETVEKALAVKTKQLIDQLRRRK